MRINFVEIGKQYIAFNYNQLIDVIRDGNFVGGQRLGDFEALFSTYVGVPYCVGVGSGTDALVLALKALGIGPGDEVIVPANTFIATAFAVSHVGAKPIFCDVEPDFYTIDPEKIEPLITTDTKAIIPVHLYGQPAEMSTILYIANNYGLKVIEDCAQAFNAEYEGKKVGSLGDVGCFSFYPAKNFGGLGQGGAVTTNDPAVADAVRSLGNLGRVDGSHYLYDRLGCNSRLDTINAVFLESNLANILTWNANRVRAAAKYDELLAKIPQVTIPAKRSTGTHVYHLYELNCGNLATRDALKEFLYSYEIECGLHYPVPCHKQEVYAADYNTVSCPVAEGLSDSLLSLPIHPYLTDDEVNYVCERIEEYFN